MKNKTLKSPALLLCLLLPVAFACKSKKADAGISNPAPVAVVETGKALTTGKITHEFASTGCGAVIVVSNPGADPMILIPYPKLTDFDVDGKEIKFHYQPLKIKNPDGCTKGFPARLSDVAWK